jgi:DNA-directed RNA polymerase subunit RPC12/RpoP
MATIRAAFKAGRSVTVKIAGRIIQYEPGLPASGMTMFGENGFLIGREAFTSEAELAKTVLHELYRLTTSTAKTAGDRRRNRRICCRRDQGRRRLRGESTHRAQRVAVSSSWKAWVEAAKILGVDPLAKVKCPVCGQAYLDVHDEAISSEPERRHERYLTCPRCGARNVMLMRDSTA